MKIRSHHIASFLLAGAVTLSSFAWLGFQTPVVYATCGSGATVTITSPSADGTTIAGLYQLQAETNTTTAPTSVTFKVTSPTLQIIGESTVFSGAVPSMNWSFPWNTATMPDGPYHIQAISHIGANLAYDCSSTAVVVTIRNNTTTQPPTLTVAITPNSWSGLPGQQGSFTVSGTYKNEYGTAYPVSPGGMQATYLWQTTGGTLTAPSAPTTLFTARPLAGNYPLTAKVTVNGLNAIATANIRVNSTINTTTATPAPTKTPISTTTSTSPTPPPATTTTTTTTTTATTSGVAGTTPLSTAQITELATTPTVFRPIAPTNSAPVVSVPILGCLKEKLGTNYALISSGQTQPTTADRLKASVCFSGSDKIPSSMAPVAPSHIAEVTTSKDIIKLTSVKNATIKNSDGKKIAVLHLSGTSIPNSSVFLYIFSDPMVLRAETDGDGKYNYVLQNPLTPGKHEVYAVSAKDASTFVRSQVIPITIASAASDGQNGSLVLESGLQPMQVGFIIASILMVFAAMMILFRIVRRRKPVLGTSAVVYSTQSPANPSDSVTAPNQTGVVFTPSPNSDSPLVQPVVANQQPPVDNQQPPA